MTLADHLAYIDRQIELCRQTLRYSVAGLNGHIWGKCDNQDYVRWMQ